MHAWINADGNNLAAGAYPARTFLLTQRTVTQGQSPDPLEEESRTYAYVAIASAHAGDAVPELTQRTVKRQGGRRVQTVYAYDDPGTYANYHHPNAIVEKELGSEPDSAIVVRTRDLRYDHPAGVSASGAYLVGLLDREMTTVGGETVTKAWSYRDNGFREGETVSA